MLRLASIALLLVACSSGGSADPTVPAAPERSPAAPTEAAPTTSASPPPPVATPVPTTPIDTSALTACPKTGDGAFTGDNAVCMHFTPIDAGASAAGENAGDANYAVRPSTGPASSLVLFFIGTGGKPSGVLKAGPKRNFYNAAVMEGRAILGVAYANDESVGAHCKRDDACFLPTRKSILLATNEPGSTVTIPTDVTYLDRATRALRYLAAGDPQGGWDAFLSANGQLAWSKILTAGHSQGGGHAAVIGKLFPIARVIQLSSACDNDGESPASWLNGSGAWQTDPKQFWGLGTQGDQTCPFHADAWAAEGMVDAHQDDDGEVCGNTFDDTHGESLKCADNFPTWRQMLR